MLVIFITYHYLANPKRCKDLKYVYLWVYGGNNPTYYLHFKHKKAIFATI